jgi:hypothetical protein
MLALFLEYKKPLISINLDPTILPMIKTIVVDRPIRELSFRVSDIISPTPIRNRSIISNPKKLGFFDKNNGYLAFIAFP